MTNKKLSVLFLCTGNSCRSIMAEALLNHHGGERFEAYSAGSFPTGEVHPLSIETLENKAIECAGYRSKSWDEFADINIDIVITVCDSAAGEVCPVFYGNPVKAHWGVSDPAKFEGSDEETHKEFFDICNKMEVRVKALLALSFEGIDKNYLLQKLNDIGKL